MAIAKVGSCEPSVKTDAGRWGKTGKMKKPAAIKKTGRARIRVDVELPVGVLRHRLHAGNLMPAVPRAVAKATDGGVLQLGDFPSIMAENQVDFHPA